MHKIIKRLGLLLIFLSLAACQDRENPQTQMEIPNKITIAQMSNDVNENVPSLHTQFVEHLTQELGIEVEEVETSIYAIGVEALARGEVDILQVTPMSYYLAKEKTDVSLLATTSREVEYYSSFIARSDNTELNTLEDLKGHTIAFVNPGSTSGFLYPKATLVKELKLESNRFEQSGYFFDQIAYSGNHNTSVIGVTMGDYDAAAVASSYLPRYEEAGLIEKGELKEIGRTINIPNPAYVMRENWPESFKQAVSDAFLSFENEAYFEALYDDPMTRFIKAEDTHFDEAIELLDMIDAIEGE